MIVDILLATYNGARSLPAQLRSLQAQTMDDFRVLIHDDGSSDATLSIIREIAAHDLRFVLLDDGLTFGNPALNFLHILHQSTAPYAIFCDQDDIWLDTKLEELLDAIKGRDNNIPQAVYCNSFVWNPQSDTCGGHATLAMPRTLKELFFINAGVQGCAVLMNEALRNKLSGNIPEHIAMHDHLIALAALTWGEYTYLPRHLMIYRRSPRAVTGETDGSLRARMRQFFKRIHNPVLCPLHFKAIRSFYQTYKQQIPPQSDTQFSDFFRFERQNRLTRLIHVIGGNYTLYGKKTYLMAKILFRPFL